MISLSVREVFMIADCRVSTERTVSNKCKACRSSVFDHFAGNVVMLRKTASRIIPNHSALFRGFLVQELLGARVYSVLHAVKYLFGRPVNCGVVKTIRYMADDHIAGTPGQDRNLILTPHIKVREYILIESRVTP